MKIYDISMLIEKNMMVYNDAKEKRPEFKNMANHTTSSYYETKVCLDIHAGTHIDMPLHMIKGGKTMDTFDFKRLITPCKVFDMTNLEQPQISKQDIIHLPIEQDDFVIFKTKNSYHDKTKGFDYNFVYVDKSAAEFLKQKKINGVGIDSLGIERAQSDHMTHKLLLQDDIIILEGLELSEIEQGDYELIALPIKLKGTEGSWVRAVLVDRI